MIESTTPADVLRYIRDRISREIEMMRSDGFMGYPSRGCYPFACLWHEHDRAVRMHVVREGGESWFEPGQMQPKKPPFTLMNQTFKPYPKARFRIFEIPYEGIRHA